MLVYVFIIGFPLAPISLPNICDPLPIRTPISRICRGRTEGINFSENKNIIIGLEITKSTREARKVKNKTFLHNTDVMFLFIVSFFS